MTRYDQFVLFGDSITQDSDNQERGFGSAAALQHAYIRRLDVVNHGLSGYNTRQALKVLPQIIPTPEEARIRLLYIFFGANDAALPQKHNSQHIPLSEYKANIEKLITHPLIKAHAPRIILVTPGPVNEHKTWPHDREKGMRSVSRVAAITKSYADGAAAVGTKLGIPVVNLWKAFMTRAGWTEEWKDTEPLPGSLDREENEVLRELMYDGLHFNPEGYKILFREVMEVIEREWPAQKPERLPMVLPAWSDGKAWEEFDKAHPQ